MMRAVEIKRESEGLAIKWNDGSVDWFGFHDLREVCACAVCKELKGARLVTKIDRTSALHIRQMDLVGNYAVGIMWNDGHRSIYAFDRIRSLKDESGSNSQALTT